MLANSLYSAIFPIDLRLCLLFFGEHIDIARILTPSAPKLGPLFQFFRLEVGAWNQKRAVEQRHLNFPKIYNPKLLFFLNSYHKLEYGVEKYPDAVMNFFETKESNKTFLIQNTFMCSLSTNT